MEDGLGFRFWLSVVGICVAVGVAGILLFTLVGAAWAKWGFFGAALFIGLVLIILAWIYDRTQAKRRAF